MKKQFSTSQSRAIKNFWEKNDTGVKNEPLYQEPACRQLTEEQKEKLRIRGRILDREICGGSSKE